MSKLFCGNEECDAYLGTLGLDSCPHCGWIDPDSIETEATEPLLQRIAHLEATASANYGRGHADAHSMLSERIADLEQELEALKRGIIEAEPYGCVTVVRRLGHADEHNFYKYPSPPYLDNASECHALYTLMEIK